MKTKKLLSVFLSAVMVFALLIPTFANEQTEPDIYTEIFTAEDFSNIRNNLDGKYKLMNDIDLSVYENWEPIGTSDTPFTGELDGNNFKISSLKVTVENSNSGNTYYGLFGYAQNAQFNNIFIINSDIDVKNLSNEITRGFVGTIFGYGKSISISNSLVSGNIDVSDFSYSGIGGIAGTIKMGAVDYCSNYSAINAEIKSNATQASVGGICGTATVVENGCSNHGDVTIEGKDVADDCIVKVGGINGNGSENIKLTDSYNRGKITVDFSSEEAYIGGLAGESYSTENSYNLGEIIYPDDFNGYVGAVSGNINTSVLYIANGPGMKNVYYINDDLNPTYDNQENFDDLSEEHLNNIYTNVNALSESEMKQQASFVGFDFEDTWAMEENGYPILKNQPKMVVKESVELEIGETYPIKPGKDYKLFSESPITIAYIEITDNNEILAIHEGKVKLVIIYDYGYTAEYDITITESDFVDTPTPDPETENKVESAEIVSVPLKNRIVFGYGSPNTPEGIVLKLKYKDGTEKTETIIRTDDGCYAGEERIFGGVHLTVVEFGKQTETLYVNDESVSVEYDYFVIPPLRSIIYKLLDTFFGFLFPIRMF